MFTYLHFQICTLQSPCTSVIMIKVFWQGNKYLLKWKSGFVHKRIFVCLKMSCDQPNRQTGSNNKPCPWSYSPKWQEMWSLFFIHLSGHTPATNNITTIVFPCILFHRHISDQQMNAWDDNLRKAPQQASSLTFLWLALYFGAPFRECSMNSPSHHIPGPEFKYYFKIFRILWEFALVQDEQGLHFCDFSIGSISTGKLSRVLVFEPRSAAVQDLQWSLKDQCPNVEPLERWWGLPLA